MTPTPADDVALVKRLRACAEDPMWDDHAEVPKQLCAAAANALEEANALAEHYMAQRDEERTRAAIAADRARQPEAIDMVLHCPACGMQHVDSPEGGPEAQPDGTVHFEESWTNPPHRSHLCHGCGHIWRPADVPTNGVAAVKTKGKNDSAIAADRAKRAGLTDIGPGWRLEGFQSGATGRETAWMCSRTLAPFRTKEGLCVWAAPTMLEALNRAQEALGITPPAPTQTQPAQTQDQP